MSFSFRFCAPIAIVSIVAVATAPAAPIAFTVNSSQSPVTASIDNATEQSPGSFTTSMEGTLTADLSSPGSISFPGGGLLDPIARQAPSCRETRRHNLLGLCSCIIRASTAAPYEIYHCK